MQESNVFFRRKDRYSNNPKFIKETYNTFDFNNNLKSDKIEELEFTNYLSSDNCNKYFLLLDICKKLSKNGNKLNKLFMTDELDTSRYSAKRVYDIMDFVNKMQIDKKKIIYKFKNNEDPGIQFYVSLEDGTLKLYLIDIYHIVIEAVNKRTGKADRKAIYNKRKKCNYDLKNIQNEINKNYDKP